MKKINICYAVDENYVNYLRVSMYSVLKNRSREYSYEFIILHSNLSENSREFIRTLITKEANADIRFVDVSSVDGLKAEVASYLTVATYYRLYLLSDCFADYERILYLDCDTIAEKDVSELFFTDIEDKAVAGVEEISFRVLSRTKKAVFINGSIPYNIDNYRKEALLMKNPQSYFNAGVILFDLTKCRKECSFEEAVEILRTQKYNYHDQDVLNMLFDGKVKLLDYGWNYQNCAEVLCKKRPEIYNEMFADVRCKSPKIIHFVSYYKPWKFDVEFGDIYKKYEKETAEIE